MASLPETRSPSPLHLRSGNILHTLAFPILIFSLRLLSPLLTIMKKLASFLVPFLVLLGVVLAIPIAQPDTDSPRPDTIHGLSEGSLSQKSTWSLIPSLGRRSPANNNQKTVVVHKVVYVRPAKPSQKPAPAPQKTTAQSTKSPASNGGWQEQMLKLVNDERKKFGKKALTLNPGLNSAAQKHSEYQNSIKQMTHNNPKGGLFERIKPFVSGARGAAENVAFNQRSVDDVMKAWINSPGHHDNIVGPYDSVGFGQSNWYWTQEFITN